ncbi:MAG: hypothetical protein H6706_20910 [Myxococcales bacterium]|nr:hypothetical protein [Myxococcales bacterium]
MKVAWAAPVALAGWVALVAWAAPVAWAARAAWEAPAAEPGACGGVTLLDAPRPDGDDAAWHLEGEIALGRSQTAGSCAGLGPRGGHPFVAPAVGLYTFHDRRRPTRLDTVVYLRDTCDAADSEIACNDDEGGLQSGLMAELDAGQAVHVFVDSFGPAASGPFRLTVLRADGDAPPVWPRAWPWRRTARSTCA